MTPSEKAKLEIDLKNSSLWQQRYNDPAQVECQALALLKSATRHRYEKGKAYCRLNLAHSFFLQDKPRVYEELAGANHYFVDRAEEEGSIWILILQSNVHESLGEYDKGLQCSLKAFHLATTQGKPEPAAEAASMLGLIYSRLGNYSKTLDYYEKALKIREELSDFGAVASSLNRMGMIYRLMGDFEQSLSHYFKSFEIREKHGMTGAIPYSLLGIASTYESMENFPLSLEFYIRGIQTGDKRCILQCRLGAGRVMGKINQLSEAEIHLEVALQLARELKSKSLTAEVFVAQAVLFERMDQPGKALEAYKNHLKAKEAYLNEESQTRLRNVEIAHEVEKSEQEKEIYRLKHVELKIAYDLVEEKNKEITAGINYARRIQSAILPEMVDFKSVINRAFVLYLPKDILSGDFYWFAESENKVIFTVADCTGHGVPGALMSMLGMSFLEEIVNNREIWQSNEIINHLRVEVIRAMHQTGKSGENKDGMDISLCILDPKANQLYFSGAYNPAYIVRGNELFELEADRMPVGVHEKQTILFSEQIFKVESGDMVYLSSDGFKDQFGGPEKKKFKASALKELLIKISKLGLEEQCLELENKFNQWKGSGEQIDDVTIMGFRI